MFFKKKNEELTDQLATYQERGSPRWGAPKFDLDAGMSIEGFDGEGQLGNISITGCSMKSITYVNIKPNDIYNVTINPGHQDKMEPFKLRLKLTWTKSSETSFLAGFSVEGREGVAQLKQYVEVLRARGIEPDYGNMKR